MGNNSNQKNKRPYDYEADKKLRKYVDKRYRNQLTTSCFHVYRGLKRLEEDRLGFCQPMTLTYRDIAEASYISLGTVGRTLTSLKGVLCEVEIGDPIKGNKKATQIRRYTLPELMNGEPKRMLIDYSPVSAKHLAELLNARSVNYGGQLIRPYWNVLQSGRVQSSKPNIQGDKPETRANRLCVGLKPGEVLIYADFKSAEPSIIQQAVGFNFSECPYSLLAELEGIDRRTAKGKVNMLAYCNAAVKVVPHWSQSAQADFMPYAEALDHYKEKLWDIGKPRNKQQRYVNTLGGSKISVVKGKSAHRGKIMSWHIQGTVADILNSVCLKIIGQEEAKRWQFMAPLHDAVYVIGQPEQAQEIKELMQDEAQRLNLEVGVDIEIFTRAE